MFKQIFRVGIRTSLLALKQAQEVLCAVRKYYPDIKVQIIGIDTYGDKDKNIPIEKMEGTDFFTKEIDEALLKGEIDFAVHSAKDLPDIISDKLYVVIIDSSVDKHDVLVSKDKLKLEELPNGASIGTSSLRRKTQLKAYRSDFRLINIRGNIEERLEKLDNSDLNGIVLASAGLIRLGLEKRITQIIPFDILKSHPLQGSLAIEMRIEDKDIIRLFSKCFS